MIGLVGYRARSGTSALVGALLAGGVDVAYSTDTEQRFRESKLADANPRGFYELSPVAWWRDRARLLDVDGRVAKAVGDLSRLPLFPDPVFEVVLLVRESREIDRSAVHTFGSRQDNRPLGDLVDRLRLRPDVAEVALVDYRELVTFPERALERVPWDVPDLAAAARFIDPDLWRFRGRHRPAV